MTGFEKISSEEVPAFGIHCDVYRHPTLGLRHVHLSHARPQHSWAMQFATFPEDDSGVAHILEHSVLQGSRRFPVPGIFFKRYPSLLGQCNAYTSREWTRYLFTSASRADFEQMFQLYVDACFFPLLEKEVFQQEGHHLEWKDPADPSKGLKIVGIVYNEMKGSYSEPGQRFHRALQQQALPGTAFARDSGGDPAAIRELNLEQFRTFHREHYHPSNAVSCYCGPLSAGDLLGLLEEHVIQPGNWQGITPPRDPGREGRLTGTRTHSFPYPFRDGDTDKAWWQARAWVAGNPLRLEEELRMHYLLKCIAWGAATPLQQALLATGKGAPYLSILDGCTRPVIGRMNTGEADAQETFALLDRELERIVREGLPARDLQAVGDSLELELRDTEDAGGGLDSFPIQLVERALEALPLKDPLALCLNPISLFQRLRGELQEPERLQALVRERLLENPKRVDLVMHPDPDLAAAEEKQEADWLARRLAGMKAAEKQALPSLKAAIELRRADSSRDHLILRPRPADIEPVQESFPATRVDHGRFRQVSYLAACNGMASLRLEQAPDHAEEGWIPRLALTGLLPNMGYGDYDYEQAQKIRRELGTGTSVALVHETLREDPDRVRLTLRASVDLRPEKLAGCAHMLRDSLWRARLEDPERWRELLGSVYTRRRQHLFGHGVAQGLMLELTAQHTASGALNARLDGFRSLSYMKGLLEDGDLLQRETKTLQDALADLASRPLRALYISDELPGSALADVLAGEGAWTAPAKCLAPEPIERRDRVWLCNTQVHYAGLSLPGLPADHADAPLLKLVAGILTFKYLLPVIREEHGAYSAYANSGNGAFLLQTYRDPRLLASLEDLRGALDWFMGSRIPQAWVEEAALTQLGQLISSHSPIAGILKQEAEERAGRTAEVREREFRVIQQATLADLRRVVEEHLLPGMEHAAAVLVSSEALSASADLAGWEKLQAV